MSREKMDRDQGWGASASPTSSPAEGVPSVTTGERRALGCLYVLLGTVGIAAVFIALMLGAKSGWVVLWTGLAVPSLGAVLRGFYMVVSGRQTRLSTDAESHEKYKNQSFARRFVPVYFTYGGILCGVIIAVALDQPTWQWAAFGGFGMLAGILATAFLDMHENSKKP